MRRRDLLQGTGIAAASTLLAPLPALTAPTAISRVRPGTPAWPDDAAWNRLRETLSGRLTQTADVAATHAPDAFAHNPFARGARCDIAQSTGWLGAWRATPSAYVVEAETPADVAAAVHFASEHMLRLVIRGGGHSFCGTSSAPDSLMVWTRKLDTVIIHDDFVPRDSSAAPVHAVSVGAGCMWLHVYQAVVGGAGRYVQGGGCTTVGVSGLVLGGGFGNFSKAFGLAAASLLEAEIVTADGAVRIVNEAREPDLFWALKGGGGGTFGVVTRMTLATHPLPDKVGALGLTLRAHSNEAYRRLLARFVDLYADTLCNPHWGEQAHVAPDRSLRLTLVFQNLTKAQALAAIQPLVDFAAASPADYEGSQSLSATDVPARWFWNAWVLRFFARSAVDFDDRPGAAWTDFWWHGDGDQVGAFWTAYGSRWLPARLLDPPHRATLVDALHEASGHAITSLHFNKGLAGAPDAVVAAARRTAMNPDVASSFALAISGTSSPDAIPDGAPAEADAHRRAARIAAALDAIAAVAPDAGSYGNESDFFLKDWSRAFWGDNYARLRAIKTRYDPDGLFFVHHGVGSEDWTPDGFSRT